MLASLVHLLQGRLALLQSNGIAAVIAALHVAPCHGAKCLEVSTVDLHQHVASHRLFQLANHVHLRRIILVWHTLENSFAAMSYIGLWLAMS